MASYTDLLKHPKWQRKRLEILERAEFKCESCGDAESTLHVHHGYYERDKKPWEYPNESLHCLCEKCHGEAERQRSDFKELCKGLSPYDYSRLSGYVAAMLMEADVVSCVPVADYEFANGLGDYFRVPATQVIDLARQCDFMMDLATMRALKKLYEEP